jgi:hypothetical protein
VDDAGAGYSSFRHILNLHPDVIKLDIALTRGIDGDPARRALGSALLTFGLDAYNASIEAEGIETEGEFKTLRALGCPFGQGYYLGRPGKLRTTRPDPATTDLLWRPPPSPPPIPAAVHPSAVTYGALPGVPGPPLVSDRAAEIPDPIHGDGPSMADRSPTLVPRTPRRDDHAEFLALVEEIQNRQADDEERSHRRRSPLKTLRTR